MTSPEASGRFRAEDVRRDFPALSGSHSGRIYLDSAATTQKPGCVIEAVSRAYSEGCANVHRGAHELGDRMSRDYEGARQRAARFLGAGSAEEIVLTSGCTASLNLVAQCWGANRLNPGDEVLVSAAEHHSNFLPWQALCQRAGARLREIPIDDRGELSLDAYRDLLGEPTRLVALAHVSNVLGTVNPVAVMTQMAHDVGAVVVVDGAQAVSRLAVDVQSIGCDFYALSGHKLYAPFGTGALYARAEQLAAMQPAVLGGGMALEVTLEKSTFVAGPRRFEAGTPNVAGAIGLARAIDYVTSLGMDAVRDHDRQLLRHARSRLSSIPGIRLLGRAENALGVVSFVHPDVHPHDLSTVCDGRGIAIRAGHHCAQPLMRRLGVVAAARASFGVYNTTADVDALVDGVREAIEIFSS